MGRLWLLLVVPISYISAYDPDVHLKKEMPHTASISISPSAKTTPSRYRVPKIADQTYFPRQESISTSPKKAPHSTKLLYYPEGHVQTVVSLTPPDASFIYQAAADKYAFHPKIDGYGLSLSPKVTPSADPNEIFVPLPKAYRSSKESRSFHFSVKKHEVHLSQEKFHTPWHAHIKEERSLSFTYPEMPQEKRDLGHKDSITLQKQKIAPSPLFPYYTYRKVQASAYYEPNSGPYIQIELRKPASLVLGGSLSHASWIYTPYLEPLSCVQFTPATPKCGLKRVNTTLAFPITKLPRTSLYPFTYVKKPLPTSFSLAYEIHEKDLLHSAGSWSHPLPHPVTHYSIDEIVPIENREIKPIATSLQKYSMQGKTELTSYHTVPSLYELQTEILSTEFTTKVEVIKDPKEGRYYFEAKIQPLCKEELHRVRQNIFFVIDQSKTIGKERLHAFTKSILKAVQYLHPDDAFTVVLFDRQFEPFSKHLIHYSKQTKRPLEDFLKKASYISLSHPQEYSKLLSYIEKTFDPPANELNTIILLTNGAAYKTYHLQQEKLERFTKKNKRKFHIHTVSAGENSFKKPLRLISLLNQGIYTHSKTYAALPRKLALQVKKTSYPLLTDVHATVIDSSSNVKLFSKQEYFDAFYADIPFTLYGESDSLDSFDIMIQGKVQDEWVNITQTVHLQSADIAEKELRRRCIVIEKETSHYQPFLHEVIRSSRLPEGEAALH